MQLQPSGAILPATVPVQPDAEEARRLLREELAKVVYQEAEPSLLERAWTAVLNWLGEVLSQIRSVDAGLGTILLAVGAVVVILVAVLLVKPRLNARRRRADPAVFDSVARLSSEAHRQLADDAAAGGHWDTALAERFRAITRAAEERLVLDEQAGRTAGEVAVQLQAAFSPLATDISWLASRFNEVHYGARPAARNDYERAAQLDGKLARMQPQRSNAEARWVTPV